MALHQRWSPSMSIASLYYLHILAGAVHQPWSCIVSQKNTHLIVETDCKDKIVTGENINIVIVCFGIAIANMIVFWIRECEWIHFAHQTVYLCMLYRQCHLTGELDLLWYNWFVKPVSILRIIVIFLLNCLYLFSKVELLCVDSLSKRQWSIIVTVAMGLFKKRREGGRYEGKE